MNTSDGEFRQGKQCVDKSYQVNMFIGKNPSKLEAILYPISFIWFVNDSQGEWFITIPSGIASNLICADSWLMQEMVYCQSWQVSLFLREPKNSLKVNIDVLVTGQYNFRWIDFLCCYHGIHQLNDLVKTWTKHSAANNFQNTSLYFCGIFIELIWRDFKRPFLSQRSSSSMLSNPWLNFM